MKKNKTFSFPFLIIPYSSSVLCVLQKLRCKRSGPSILCSLLCLSLTTFNAFSDCCSVCIEIVVFSNNRDYCSNSLTIFFQIPKVLVSPNIRQEASRPNVRQWWCSTTTKTYPSLNTQYFAHTKKEEKVVTTNYLIRLSALLSFSAKETFVNHMDSKWLSL